MCNGMCYDKILKVFEALKKRKYIGDNKINASPVFADIDNDNIPEIISAAEEGALIIFNAAGTAFENFPINYNYGFISSPTIIDLDNDNDLEIIIGTNQNLSVIDLKTESYSEQNYWNTYRANNARTGYMDFSDSCTIADINSDGNIDILDIVQMVDIIMEFIHETFYEQCAADINSDGTVDIFDIIILVNLILN